MSLSETGAAAESAAAPVAPPTAVTGRGILIVLCSTLGTAA